VCARRRSRSSLYSIRSAGDEVDAKDAHDFLGSPEGELAIAQTESTAAKPLK
jgi:hypothetical protein